MISNILLPQLLALPGSLALLFLAAERMPHGYLGWVLVGGQGAVALAIARIKNMPSWWQGIHFVFPILAGFFILLPVPPGVYLAICILLILLYGIPGHMQAPLFFSGKVLLEVLAKRLPTLDNAKFLDLGCGIGTVVIGLQRLHPNLRLCGVEKAWLPYGITQLRKILGGISDQVNVQYGDFWDISWGEYDVVFAFLSPDPMAAIWFKARSEMKPGSWLYSYRFMVPGVEPNVVIQDRKGRYLYGWQVV